MSYKTFQNGFPLPASDLNNYLMNQVVATFANNTARASAIASPQEGQVTYLEDTEAYEKWDGSAWVDLFPEAVAATSPNYIINGAFDFWQRGTSSTFSATTQQYLADRFLLSQEFNSTVYSRQTFTPGSAPVAGYESKFFARADVSLVSNALSYTQISQRIENVTTLAGQTATISYWAKADAAKSVAIELQQGFGTGGSPGVLTFVAKQALTTSWARYTHTINIPSIAGKTLGSGNDTLNVVFWLSAGSNFNSRTSSLGEQNITFDIWGLQVEAGSVATPFRRNANSIQGELAACQRYYVRFTGSGNGMLATQGGSTSTTSAVCTIALPVEMRVIPTAIESGGTIALTQFTSSSTVTALTLQDRSTTKTGSVTATTASHTANTFSVLRQSSDANAYLAFSAEL